MDKRLYTQLAEVEDSHWWFIGRRKIIETVIKNKILKSGNISEILDAGCGTGGNLDMLSGFTDKVVGMELDPEAARFASEKNTTEIYQGRLPEDIPFADNSFELIVLLDVLEHIDNDVLTIQALSSKLKPGGYLLITVPAFSFLWSRHDEIHHHKRRYRLKELEGKLNGILEIKYISYFNTWLFPFISLIRICKSKFGILDDSDDLKIPVKWINKLLIKLMSSESFILKKFTFPFGVSIVALGQKR